jgi:hypothetical protein
MAALKFSAHPNGNEIRANATDPLSGLWTLDVSASQFSTPSPIGWTLDISAQHTGMTVNGLPAWRRFAIWPDSVVGRADACASLLPTVNAL